MSFGAPEDSTPVRQGIEERLARMIRVETVSAEREQRGDKPFDDFAALIAELYPLVREKLGFERIGRGGLVYRWDGADPEQDPVILMAHYDVVPVAGQESDWDEPPFSGTIRDGHVWGRGALDDKGALCILLDAVENLLQEGFQPQRTVYLALGGDEEVFGQAALDICNTLRERGVQPWLVLDEGGAITNVPFPGVDDLFAMVGVGEKGLLEVTLEAEGVGGHASTPPRLTAVGRIARAVAKVNRNPFRAKMPATVKKLLEGVAPYSSKPAVTRLLTFAAKADFLSAKVLALLGGQAAAMVRTTLAPTMLGGGSASNVLPSDATAELNIRIISGETVAGVVKRLERAIGDPQVKVRTHDGYDPTPESATDNAQYALIEAGIAAAYPGLKVLPYLTMGATDSRHWHRFSPAVYRFAPLVMGGELYGTVHGANERIAIDSLVRGERFHRAVIQKL
jgi:carboxypeptidase PM20D1